MFKTTTTYKVQPTVYLNEIMPKGLPVNAFINKGRCGIGGTTLELKDKSRSTIITVPNISILISKNNSVNIDERPDYIVFGEITNGELFELANDYKKGCKIMSTPEGVKRLMDVFTQMGRLDELYNQWFLLLDESHTFVSELYRKNILIPFNYFWNFKNKSIISATPFFFSDPRFYELDHHVITFTEPLGKVLLVEAVSVDATLHYILSNSNVFKGNLHIFYNSVTAIKEAILRSNITDCNIFCANDRDQKNLTNLGDLKKFFVAEPRTGLYKKVNFYTCKYFEGWDLEDPNATLILVTDIYKPHTKVGVASKGKQALGRFRTRPSQDFEQLIHITNHESKQVMISLDRYRVDFTETALKVIKDNNDHIKSESVSKVSYNKIVEPFADVDDRTKIATLNYLKLDQQINESAFNEIYRNIRFIKEDWERAFFLVKLKHSYKKLESKTVAARKSASQILNDDIEALNSYSVSDESTWFYFGETVAEEIKKRNPLAYKAATQLTKPFLEEVKYNVKKVQLELILQANQLAESKLKSLLKRAFRRDNFYFNSFITTELQQCYTTLEIKDPKTGEIKTASPNQLSQWFETSKPLKRVNRAGNKEYGLLILGIKLDTKLSD